MSSSGCRVLFLKKKNLLKDIMLSAAFDTCLLRPGDQVRRAPGRASEGRAAHGRGEAEEADAEEEPRVRLPDPPGEDGAAAPGPPGLPPPPSVCRIKGVLE